MQSRVQSRQLPIGAEVTPGGVHVRVWAPRRRQVAVVLEGGPGTDRAGAPVTIPLEPEADGYFAGPLAGAAAGTRYRFRLDDDDWLYPDPASRFQPAGPHGPSEVVDPATFAWTDGGWTGVSLPGGVIYELHIGTFTSEGTWAAAAERLPALAELGITILEVMPVADFAGDFGWGYDGVALFAPYHGYGRPDDFRRFVDRAHALDLGVILDVVYNHLGPEGNYLAAFAPAFFSDRHTTEWGDAINFDGPDAGPVREFFVVNAGYWIAEYHLDGLRLDAMQAIVDDSPDHILAALTRRVRAAAGGRATLLTAENERQEARPVRSLEAGGYGLDASWNDDYHHSARVAATGRHEAYYSDYRGTAQELLSAVKHGFLYQGQRSMHQGKWRGSPALDLPPAAFITFLQNHDQVANSGRGQRLHQQTSPGRWRALTALLLLGPNTPLLFMGQEFAASAPFLYFAHYSGELARLVRQGRAGFLAQFASLASPEAQAGLADPSDPATVARCRLDWSEWERHGAAVALHRDLLRLRREDPTLRLQGTAGLDGAVLSEAAFVLRFFGQRGDDRLLLVNLGRDLPLAVLPEPLLAPPVAAGWGLQWSSDTPRYGGVGVIDLPDDRPWLLPGESAYLLQPVPAG